MAVSASLVCSPVAAQDATDRELRELIPDAAVADPETWAQQGVPPEEAAAAEQAPGDLAPDSLDLIVAKNFGALAADLLRRGESGQMVAVVGGRYTAVPLPLTGRGLKRVDVERFYDVSEYRPKVAEVMGTPMFLH